MSRKKYGINLLRQEADILDRMAEQAGKKPTTLAAQLLMKVLAPPRPRCAISQLPLGVVWIEDVKTGARLINLKALAHYLCQVQDDLDIWNILYESLDFERVWASGHNFAVPQVQDTMGITYGIETRVQGKQAKAPWDSVSLAPVQPRYISNHWVYLTANNADVMHFIPANPADLPLLIMPLGTQWMERFIVQTEPGLSLA